MNPFQQQYVKMRFPEGMGKQIAIAGFNLDADEDGCVELPRHLQAEARAHGLEDFVEKPAAKK